MSTANYINTLATKAIAMLEADFAIEGVEITPCAVNEAIEMAAFSMGHDVTPGIDGLVKMEILSQREDVYRAAWPMIQMDQRGNYTTNPNAWA